MSATQAAYDARLAALLADCGWTWVSTEDQGHLRAIAARDAFYAREDAIRDGCGWEW
jgi:hypothetical protein